MDKPPNSPAGVATDSTGPSPLSGTQLPEGALKSNPEPFEPQSWLEAFAAVGGGWIVRPDRITMTVQYEGRSEDDQRKSSAMLNTISEAEKAVLVAHLRSLQSMEADHG